MNILYLKYKEVKNPRPERERERIVILYCILVKPFFCSLLNLLVQLLYQLLLVCRFVGLKSQEGVIIARQNNQICPPDQGMRLNSFTCLMP